MIECKCGFLFETDSEYKNFQVRRFEHGKWIMICPICGREVIGLGLTKILKKLVEKNKYGRVFHTDYGDEKNKSDRVFHTTYDSETENREWREWKESHPLGWKS